MIITPFTNKIVFKANEEMAGSVNELVKKWVLTLEGIRPFYMSLMLDKVLPIKANGTYAFDSSWSQPLGGLFPNWANDPNSYWIYVENDSDLSDLDAIMRLNVSSYRKLIKPEQALYLKQLMAKDGAIVIESYN